MSQRPADPAPGRWKSHAPLLAGTLLLLSVTSSSSGHAQGVTTAALEGVVSGADSALEAAEILVTNLSTGERWHATTSRGGRYAFEHLSPGGPYQVDVRAIGFVPSTRTDVSLALNTRTRLDVALGVRVQLLEPLEVRAEADPNIGPERMGPEQVLSGSTLRRLPIRGRELTSAITVGPQATARDNKVSISGRDPRFTTLEVDGAAAGNLLGGAAAPDLELAARPLAVEALQRLEVRPAPYDVRYGSSSAGTVEAITRSGTNTFEGSAWGYYTSRHLQRSDGSDLGPDNATAGEGGVTLGGPIVRDRSAYFLQAGLQHYVVPTDVPVIGRDTAGGADSAGIGFTQGSANRLRQILLDQYGFDPGTADRFPLDLPAANLFAKITWQPRVNSRLELWHAYDASTVDFLYDGCRVAYALYCLTGSHFVLPVRTHATRMAWTASLGSGVANQLVLARRRFTKHCESAPFPSVLVGADAGVFVVGANSVCGGDRDLQHILELTDDVTFGLGAHRVTVGTHAERVRISLREVSIAPLNAIWEFANLDALAAARPFRYEAYAANPARAGTGAFIHVASEQVALYAQDQATWGRWRLTAGLRADLAFGLTAPTFNRTLLDSLDLDNRKTPGTDVRWAPRLGLSYDARGDGRLFLRGGLGWFGGRPPFGWFAQAYARTGLEDVHIVCEGDAVPPFSPDRAHQPSACADGSSESIPGPVVLFEPMFHSPHTFKASVGSDARLPGGLVLTTDVIYTRGGGQLSLRDANLLPAIGAAQAEAGRPLFGIIDVTGGVVTGRRTGAFERVVTLGSRSRDRSLALSVQAQKQLGSGATVGASYTYTDASDLMSATQDDLDAVVDSTTVESPLEHSLRPSAWSVPHRVTLLVAADLPLNFAVSFFYAGQSGSPFTYSVAGDANADGYINDPIYVPADARIGGDVSLVVDDGQGGVAPAPAGAYDDLAAYVRSQRCLWTQRGRLATRNSCRNPWRSETEARLARTFPAGRRSVTLTVDVFNLLNLFSARWGKVRSLSDAQILRLAGYDAAQGRGVYQYQPPDRRQREVQASRWR
ncbi:MAG: carboxypeptidase regulatory-like domain-containing protein, partial [Gemmatimonadales bacterium]